VVAPTRLSTSHTALSQVTVALVATSTAQVAAASQRTLSSAPSESDSANVHVDPVQVASSVLASRRCTSHVLFATHDTIASPLAPIIPTHVAASHVSTASLVLPVAVTLHVDPGSHVVSQPSQN
jgi:hypothetical protein